ncbi:inorganic phosphate transporter [Robiginitomaculum antarcticum]|uniref:inorganic phosphate transporter n=1 Tax=Robiginitomaculum antarcticum TaxID=437507 RepID=UPI0003A78035|nr:inorganic phosphate transporter [Robiginitomaculum antarcticum]
MKDRIINFGLKDVARLSGAIVFLVIIYVFVRGQISGGAGDPTFLILAAVIGGYMAMNIGANDVANNVGPAVGSKALTMTGAILIAVVMEASGALIAGGDVVSTIKKGIIDPAYFGDDVQSFIWAMTAALLAAAIWLNVATAIGAPVSTTHSIVGGVLGAGIAAGGWGIANWDTVQQIVASWVISPVMGGVIAATFLYIIKRTVLDQRDLLTAARKTVPFLVAIMGWAFTTYLILKGVKKLVKVDFLTALGLGFVMAVAVFFIVRILVKNAAVKMQQSHASVDRLFLIPLIVSAALLSFAHGANDVANAIGPLAAINEAVFSGAIASEASIPLWVMLVGALGIAVGLALYGPKLIKTVGSEITELDMSRAFCVALAAAITVIIASQLGLPVSSTHIAVGGIFGVGFLREVLNSSYNEAVAKIKRRLADAEDPHVDEAFVERFDAAPMTEKRNMLRELKRKAVAEQLTWSERRDFKKAYKAKLVERSMLYKIVAAWIITVPLTGLFAAGLYFMLRGIMVV